MRHEAGGRRQGPARVPGLLWAGFATAALITAVIVPVHVLVQGVLAPLGLVPAFDRRYSTFAAALANWLVKIYLMVFFAAAFYTFGHRLRYLLLDLGVRQGKAAVALTCYGLALAGTVAAVVILINVP